jgi:hypothetical protein
MALLAQDGDVPCLDIIPRLLDNLAPTQLCPTSS